MHLLTLILGWGLAVASTVTALPQAIHLLKARSFAGVHIWTPAVAAVTMFTWCLYTARIHDAPALFSSIGPLIAWSTSLVALTFLGAPKASRILLGSTLIAISLSILCSTNTLPLGFFAALAATGSCLWALPQLFKLLRKPGKDLTGISSLAYTALGLENAAWILYAVFTKTPTYAIAPIIQLPACLIIALHARKFHRLKKSRTAHPSAKSTFHSPSHSKQIFKVLATNKIPPLSEKR